MAVFLEAITVAAFTLMSKTPLRHAKPEINSLARPSERKGCFVLIILTTLGAGSRVALTASAAA